MTDVIVFTYDGSDVSFDQAAKMWNLNAMHRAAGNNPNKSPWRWSETAQAQEFIDALCTRSNLAKNEVWHTRQGNQGGTWAHWQIAAAYAHYLKPEFYIQWNEWAMERVHRLQGQPVDSDRLTALEARLTALEGAQAVRVDPPSVLVLARSLDDLATAIIAALRTSEMPRSPAELARLLTAHGFSGLSGDQMKTRLARLARRGAIAKCGRGRYTARTIDDPASR